MMKADSRAIPPAESTFMPVRGPLGYRLALVFGNESHDGRCPFFATQCMHCDIGGGEGFSFSSDLNCQRLEYFKTRFEHEWERINHLVVYNYGSTLNEAEFSRKTLKAVLDFVKACPSIKRASFDSREFFVTEEIVRFMVANTRVDQVVSVTLGFETQSEELRLDYLKKKISKEQVKKVFAALATSSPRSAVEMNVLFQPPGVAGNEAVKEAVATAAFGLEMMRQTGVRVDFNFHPYYPSIKGSDAYPDHPRARLEDAVRSLILISRMIKDSGGESLLFVGGNDEGHDLQPSLKQMKQLLYDPAFAAFNVSQDEKDLMI